jgi:ADP-ribose pyrophosphatase
MITKWKLVSSTRIIKSEWLTLYNHSYLLPCGKIGKNYYHLEKPDYTLIVAINNKKEIALEKNYRRGVKETLIELPAGYIHKGESPRKSAERELKEETGYVGQVKLIKQIYPTPSFCNMSAYVALIIITNDKPVEKKLANDEENEVFFWSLKKINAKIQSGEIKDMGIISALKLVEPFL